MNRITRKSTAGLMAAMLPAGILLADQMPDSQGAGTYVKTISIEATNPYPVFIVKSDGEKYTHVEDDGNKKTFLARVTGVCTNIAKVNFASYNLHKTKYSSGMVAHKSLAVNPKNKTFGHNIAVNIQWQPDTAVKNRALNACKTYMQDELNKNKSLHEILGQEHRIVMDSGLYGAFNLNCAGLLAAGVKHRFAMQPMEVRCEGSDVPLKVSLNAVKLLAITSVSLKPVAPSYTGPCPRDFKFTGHIKSNGSGGKVRYRFKNHFGVYTKWHSVTLPKGNTHYPVTHTIKLQDIKINDKPGLPNQVQGQQGGMSPLPQLGMQQNPHVILEVENLGTHKKHASQATYKFSCIKLNPVIAKHKGNLQAPVAKRPDLIPLGQTFRLGGKTVKPGSFYSLVIGSEEATQKVAGQCVFRMRYDIKNKGNATAQPAFTTQTVREGVTLHFDNTAQLAAGQTKTVSGNLKLKPGKNLIGIKVDHADKVAESNEGNNTDRIAVTVKGDCGAAVPPRPAAGGGTAPRRPESGR